MGSCSSKPGEVGSMPQEGSGSAAPMDPAAIEAVRATSSSRKQPLASPERPVTPYDRRVVSHDASRPTPSSRSPLARAPFEGEGTSPPQRGARSSATHGAMASSSAARLAAMTHGDAWPPPLEGERARDPHAQEGAETERRTSSPTRLGDASVVVYSLDGTVSTVRVPPAGASPGDASHAPSDRALQGLGSRLGAKKRALPLGRLPGSRPATGEPPREPHGDDARVSRRLGGRPATREGGRVTASEVMDAMAGTRRGGAVAFTDPAFTDPESDAFRATASAPPAETEEAFPAPNAAQIAFDPSSSDSDDEPAETLAMARERARNEERASAEKAAAADAADEAREAGSGSGSRRDDAAGNGDATLEPPPRVSRPESRILDFAADAPRLRMATLAPGPAPRPVSREAGRMPPPPPRLPRKEASPLKPPRPAPAETATAADVAADAAAEPRRETTPDLTEKNDVASRRKKKSPLEEELEAWGVSLPDSPTRRRGGGGDLVAVDDEDDDLLAAFGADADAAAEAPGATSGSLVSFRDSIPESPLVTSPLDVSSSPLVASPLDVVGETGARAETETSETETSTSPNRDFHSGSSADENAPEPRAAAADDDARARETGGFANADDAESLAWLRKTMAFETPETPSSRGTKQGGGGGGDDGDDAGVLRETRSTSFLRGRENAVVAAIPDSGATRDARGAAAKKEDTRGVDGAVRQDARGALSLLQTDSPSPGSASLSSSPRTRDSGGGASPRANALRAETVAAYGVGNTTRSRTRRKSKIPPPPSPASVRSAANEAASAGVSVSERAGENPRGPARKSARRPANPKSRLPPPPTSKTRDAEKAPDGVATGAGAAAAAKATAVKPPASSRAVHGGASSSDASAAVPTAGTRLASTTAAGYSAGAAAGKGKAEKRLAKPMKPKPAASPAASPAARVASAASDARDAPREPQRMTKKSASTMAEPEATGAPAPSATPAKLKKDHLASAPPAMTKAEEARARLRGSRQRRSIAGVASSVASSAGASSAAAAPTAAPRSPPKPAERGSDAATAAAAAAAASKLASKLGSVSVIKPRGERMSSKEGAAEKAEKRAADAARRAEHAAAFAKAAAEAEAAKAAAAKAAKEAAAREAEIRVAGVDEAEMVLRVGSLCDEKTLVGARQAVHRMGALLDDVTRLSRELKCEPQHVYGHVLHRLGFPVDRESRETPLERAVGAERAREMCAGVSELRNLLRIKVQDNNDLRLARTALCETADFFQRLDAFAAKKNKTPSEVLAAQAGGGSA
jgi:hypothetical protein